MPQPSIQDFEIFAIDAAIEVQVAGR